MIYVAPQSLASTRAHKRLFDLTSNTFKGKR